jgi:uncharacterized protein
VGHDRLVAIGVTARRRRRAAITAGLLLLVLAPGLAAAQTAPLPSLKDPVNDFAKVIDAASAAELDKRIRALHATTGDSLIVVTVPTYAPYGSIEEYAVRLFEKAGIGDKEKDTGLLIVVAVEDRAVRVELGYGLEEFISDGYSGETIRQEMLPRFREGHYGEGLVAGASRLIRRIAEKRGVEIPEVPPPAPPPQNAVGGETAGSIVAKLLVVFVILFVISRINRSRGPRPPFMGRRRSTWSGWSGGVGGFGGGFGGFGGFGGGGGGGGGGGFGGFGGGSSGGGGASGRW